MLSRTEIIQNLVERFQERCVLEGSFAQEQIVSPIESFKKNLESKSIAELLTMYEKEKQHQALVTAIIESKRDNYRFFNNIHCDANYFDWFLMKTWTIEEAVALSFGKDPIKVNSDTLTQNRDNEQSFELSPWVNAYMYRKRLLTSDVTLESKVAPITYLDWFHKNNIILPKHLLNEALACGIISLEKFNEFMSINDHIVEKDELLLEHFFINFPKKQNNVAMVAWLSAEIFVRQNKDYPTCYQLWKAMGEYKDPKYEVKVINKELITIEGEELTKNLFERRFNRWVNLP